MAVSSGAILVNRHILVDLKFPYPVTIAWLGLATTTVASAAAVKFVLPAPTGSQRMTRRCSEVLCHVGLCCCI
jgi:hypothetical protein